jgi:hypothetical protein
MSHNKWATPMKVLNKGENGERMKKIYKNAILSTYFSVTLKLL